MPIIQFDARSRALLDEQWNSYMQTVTVVARLHGIKPEQLQAGVRILEDRSGIEVPDIPKPLPLPPPQRQAAAPPAAAPSPARKRV